LKIGIGAPFQQKLRNSLKFAVFWNVMYFNSSKICKVLEQYMAVVL